MQIRTRPIKRFVVAFLAVFAALAAVISCGTRLSPNDADRGVAISLDVTEPSSKLLQLSDSYWLIVVDAGNTSDTVVSPTPLMLEGTMLEGMVDSVPAGRLLQFIAEARNADIGVLYRGTTTGIIIGEELNSIAISLSPVVPLLKFTPRFVLLGADSTYVLEAKVFNIPDLYGISFLVNWEEFYTRLDSVKPAPELPTDIIFYDSAYTPPGSNIDYQAVAVTHTISGETIADANGDTPLAWFYFTQSRVEPPDSISHVFLAPSGVTLRTQDPITVDDIYSDDCTIETILSVTQP